MADILIKLDKGIPKTHESLVIDEDNEVRIFGTDVVIGEAIELPPRKSRCIETNSVVSAITKCFADCKAQGFNPTPFIISVYIGKVPTVLEAST